MKVATDILKRIIGDSDQYSNITDRIVLSYTVQLLAFFVVLIGSGQNFGGPIQCMLPPETPKSSTSYFLGYCYIQDKYRILEKSTLRFENPVGGSSDNQIPVPLEMLANKNVRDKLTIRSVNSYSSNSRVTYYAYIPYVLTLQAFMCVLPRLFWRFFGLGCSQGLDMETAVKEARRLTELSGQDREQALDGIVKYIDDWLKLKQRHWFGVSTTFCAYVAMKWLCVINVFTQFYILGIFVGKGNVLWGVELMDTLMRGGETAYGSYFPRIVMCDLQRLDIANEHLHAFQCLLVLNAINERLFLFIFYWFAAIGVIAVVSAVRNTFLLLVTPYRRFYTDSLLPTQEVLLFSATSGIDGVPPAASTNSQLLEYFLDYLGCDGMLLLANISNRANSLMTFEIAKKLWKTSVQPTERIAASGNDVENGSCPRKSSTMSQPCNDKFHSQRRVSRRRTGDEDEKSPLVVEALRRDRSLSSAHAASASDVTLSGNFTSGYKYKEPDSKPNSKRLSFSNGHSRKKERRDSK